MTISNQTASVTYLGNGVQTVFTYNFRIPYQSDDVTPAVAVFTIDADDVQTLLSSDQFSITGVDDPLGGTVTYPLTGSPLALGTSIRIDRALLYTQPDAFPNQGFLPSTVEDLADRLVMQMQQIAAALGVTLTTQPQRESLIIALTDETTEITATGVYTTFVWPYDFNVDEVQGSLTTASDTGNFTMQIAVDAVNMLSTVISVDEGETSSLDSSVQPVVSNSAIPKGATVTLQVTAAGASAAGAKVVILGRQGVAT